MSEYADLVENGQLFGVFWFKWRGRRLASRGTRVTTGNGTGNDKNSLKD